MAKRVRTTFREEIPGDNIRRNPSYAEAEMLPDGAKKMIPFGELDAHPDNFKLVPELEEKKRIALREDILLNGIREPLHVWPVDGRLLIVSGNERLLIIQGFDGDQRTRSRTAIVPCIIKKFRDDAEARQHIITVNENRKNVSMSPPDRLLAIFPMEEVPILYADLRGYGAGTMVEEAKLPTGNFDPGGRVPIEELREEQRRAREHVSAITGWKDSFVTKVIHQASSRLRGGSEAEKASAARQKDLLRAKKEMQRLTPKIQKTEEELEEVKKKLSLLKREYRKHEKLLKKFGALPG